MKFKQLLEICNFDIFNHQFFLRIGRKSKNSTHFSILISHLLLIAMIIYFLFSSFNTFLHMNPQINIQNFDVNKRPYINLSKDNFHFAFRIEDNDGNPMNITDISEYFEIEATYYFQKQNISNHNEWVVTEERYYEFGACNKSEFTSFENYFDINLKNAFCLKDHMFDVGGFWDERKMSYFYITINMCDQENNPSCVGREAIEEKFQGSYLTFYIESENVDGNDYDNPLKKTMKYYSYLLDTNIKKDVNFYVQEVEMKTNDALFYNSAPTVQKFFRQSSIDLDFNANFHSTNNVTLNAFWEIYIYSSNNIQMVERTYITLLSVFASVGGISKFFLIIGTFITLYYNEMKLQSELLNELFLFDIEGNSSRARKRSSYLRSDCSSRILRRNFSAYLKRHYQTTEELFSQRSNVFGLHSNNHNNNENNNKNQLLNIELESPPSLLKKKTERVPLFDLNEVNISKNDSLKNVDQENKIINFSETSFGIGNNEKEEKKEIKLDKMQRHSTFPLIKAAKTKRESKLEINFEKKEENLNKDQIGDPENDNNNVGIVKEIKLFDNQKPIAHKENLENDQIDTNMERHLNNSLRRLNEAKSSQKSQLKFSFWEIIRSIFFPFCLSQSHRTKLKLYNKASDGLLKYINILQMVQMLQDFEKLKLIIFNKEQLALFNYLSKPLISLQKPEDSSEDESFSITSGTKLSKIMKYMEGGNSQEQCKDIIKYYTHLLSTGKYSNIDKKLFELLDDDLRVILDRINIQ